jgi:hypothetical protein
MRSRWPPAGRRLRCCGPSTPGPCRSPNADSRITAGQRATCSWRSSRASDPHALLTCGCGAASVFACSGGGRARMDSAKASGARSRPSPRWPHMQHRK